jgi:hypothetical protein
MDLRDSINQNCRARITGQLNIADSGWNIPIITHLHKEEFRLVLICRVQSFAVDLIRPAGRIWISTGCSYLSYLIIFHPCLAWARVDRK